MIFLYYIISIALFISYIFFTFLKRKRNDQVGELLYKVNPGIGETAGLVCIIFLTFICFFFFIIDPHSLTIESDNNFIWWIFLSIIYAYFKYKTVVITTEGITIKRFGILYPFYSWSDIKQYSFEKYKKDVNLYTLTIVSKFKCSSKIYIKPLSPCEKNEIEELLNKYSLKKE